MKIAIGSNNPVKINAVKSVLKPLFPKAGFIHLNVKSKVKNQPLSIKETKLGAKNRAYSALKTTQADLAVGLEGGVFEIDKEMYNIAWCALIDKKGTCSFGGGMCFLVPDFLARQIRQGGEMGPLMAQLTGIKDIKKKGGAISVLTKGLTNRTQGYQELVRMAMVKFRRPRLYLSSRKKPGLTT